MDYSGARKVLELDKVCVIYCKRRQIPHKPNIKPLSFIKFVSDSPAFTRRDKKETSFILLFIAFYEQLNALNLISSVILLMADFTKHAVQFPYSSLNIFISSSQNQTRDR